MPDGFDKIATAAGVVRASLQAEVDRSADPGETFDALTDNEGVDALSVVIGVFLALRDGVPTEERDHVEWVGQIALNHLRAGR